MKDQLNALLSHAEVSRLIDLCLDEDGIQNDLTTLAMGTAADQKIRATIIAKKPAVAAGGPLVHQILERAKMTNSVQASIMFEDGASLAPKTPWILFEGRAGDILRVERTILNFLIRMCGIATATNNVVKVLEGTPCKLLHTRKTSPGSRRTDIYATLVGGAHPHRRSLDDAILVKENHIRISDSFQHMIDGIEKHRSKARFVEIEVTDFVELKYALTARPDRIMLDNFKLEDIEKAVQLFSSSVQFEASGNITLENARRYADTGVDYISMGALTHSTIAADLSMLFDHR